MYRADETFATVGERCYYEKNAHASNQGRLSGEQHLPHHPGALAGVYKVGQKGRDLDVYKRQEEFVADAADFYQTFYGFAVDESLITK